MIQSTLCPKKNNQGQALVEYALLIVLVIGLFFVINNAILRGIGNVWKKMAQEVAAACPSCTPPEEIK